jgi:uncharacterized membrane protein YcaP (DUF421 family)
LFISYVRTAIIYAVLILVIRLMGKRQVGQMEPEEFVVTMLLANLASLPMEDEGVPILAGVVPIFTILSMELVLSGLSLRSIRLRRFLCGKPVILIENGRVLQNNLLRTRISQDELCSQLRMKDVMDITTVQYAILETNGSVSVFPFPRFCPASAQDAGIQAQKQALPVTIISDGKLLEPNLILSGKDKPWLQKTLRQYAATIPTTWYLAIDQLDRVIFLPKEGTG